MKNERERPFFSQKNEMKDNDKAQVLSVLGGLDSLTQIIHGRGAVLESLAKKGDRLNLLPFSNSKLVKPVLLLTHPLDMRDVWIEKANSLNKLGHAYEGLRSVFGRGLIPIETSDEWKANQRIIARHMQPKNLPDLEGFVYEYLNEMLFEANPTHDREFSIPNVNESLIQANFQITARSFFGRNATKEEATAVSHDIHIVNQFLLANALLLGAPHFLYQKSPHFLKQVHLAEASFKKYAEEIVSTASPLTGYLTALMEAGPDGTGQMKFESQRDEIILAIISSYVSTATATGWALSFLSQPEFAHFQDVVRSEANDGTIAQQKSITSMIIKEGLRLYPPVFIITRKATADIRVENELGNLNIPKGSSVFISPYITQRNSQYWERPNDFDPLRFREPSIDYSYLPFGLGQRKCIGEHYAMRVAALSLGHILRNHHFEMLKPPYPMFRATLHPSHDFAVKVSKI